MDKQYNKIEFSIVNNLINFFYSDNNYSLKDLYEMYRIEVILDIKMHAVEY